MSNGTLARPSSTNQRGQQNIRAPISLETKLILCFMAVLTFAVGSSCVIFARETTARVSDILGEQARQLAIALSRSSDRAIRAGDWPELSRTGQDLIKSRNILFVGFLDGNARAKVLASRDLDAGLANLVFEPTSLMKVSQRYAPAFGNYVEVMAPVLATPSADPEDDPPGSRLLGFVAVGISKTREEALLARIYMLVSGMACLTILLALPVAYALVHRIFLPIRELVRATQLIAGGDLDAHVETDRRDTIGQLATSFREMTRKVRAQQQLLADANRGLEERVQTRTAELATANAKLQAEITDKEDFLRTVSHDLNAPLRNISGLTTMLLNKHRESFDADVVHRLERIKANVEQECELISDLLELSRIKTRRQRMQPVDVAGVIDDLRDVFATDLRTRSIELVVETPLPVLHAEKLRIRQVFQNLIDNAIKYMGESTQRTIRIGCAIRPREVQFYIADSGIGIDPADRESLFTIFRRGRNTQGVGISGKGVGLASVRSIIDTYNGEIRIESEPGRGSTFYVTFPSEVLAPQAPEPAIAI